MGDQLMCRRAGCDNPRRQNERYCEPCQREEARMPCREVVCDEHGRTRRVIDDPTEIAHRLAKASERVRLRGAAARRSASAAHAQSQAATRSIPSMPPNVEHGPPVSSPAVPWYNDTLSVCLFVFGILSALIYGWAGVDRYVLNEEVTPTPAVATPGDEKNAGGQFFNR